ncbi:MAG: hypothetical protein WA972_19645, partial [Rhodococcus qingshengii]
MWLPRGRDPECDHHENRNSDIGPQPWASLPPAHSEQHDCNTRREDPENDRTGDRECTIRRFGPGEMAF